MNILTKTIATLTVAATAFVPMATSSAFAGQRGYYHDNHGGYRACTPNDPRCGGGVFRPHRGSGNQPIRRHHGRHRNGISGRDAAGIAILGVIGGAIIGSAINNQNRTTTRYYQNTNRYPAAPRHTKPRIITTHKGSLEPWSRSWYNYCENRYRSFNAKTGTYRGYDGKNHFCVAR